MTTADIAADRLRSGGILSFRVYGDPRGQPRARAFVRGGRASVYNPACAEGWKSCIAEAARECLPALPLAGPLSLHVTFIFGRPKAHYRTGNRASEMRDGSPRHHTSKPDMDNLLKAVMDCLTRLRLWGDDTQVAQLTALKRYCDNGDRPGALVTIQPFRSGAKA